MNLKPCPFCGGEAFVTGQPPASKYIACANNECPVICEVLDADAEEHWNRRAPVPEERAIPEGWKLVPVKPTPEMLLAAHPPFEQINAWCAEMQTARGRVPNWNQDDPPLQQAWRAMLAAAPSPQKEPT